jgi:hypothetical protein
VSICADEFLSAPPQRDHEVLGAPVDEAFFQPCISFDATMATEPASGVSSCLDCHVELSGLQQTISSWTLVLPVRFDPAPAGQMAPARTRRGGR